MLNKSTKVGLSKDDLLKLMQTGDTSALYNALQNPYYTLFIDVRESDKFQKCHIKHTLNIPLEKFKFITDNKQYLTQNEIATLIKEHKAKSMKHLIMKMYFFTDHTENEIFWHCLSFLRDTVIDLQLCRSSNDNLFVITDNFEIFTNRFPFLLTNDEKEKEEKLKKQLTSKETSNNYLSMTSLFVEKQNVGYPNIIIDDELFLGDFYHATTKQIFIDLNITHVVNCSRPQSIPCQFEKDIDLNVQYIRVPVDDHFDVNIKQYFDNAAKFVHHALNQNKNENKDNNQQNDSEFNSKLLNKMVSQGLGTKDQCKKLLFRWVNSMDIDYVINQVFEMKNKENIQVSDGNEDDGNNDDNDYKEEVLKRHNNRVLIHCQAGISRSSTITIAYLMKYKNMSYEQGLKYVRERRPIISPNSTFMEQLKEYETDIFGTNTMNKTDTNKQNSLVLPTTIKKNINVRPSFDNK